MEDIDTLYDREPEKLVRIDPVGYTANLRLVVRNPGLLAVVADLETSWDSRFGAVSRAHNVVPRLNSIYFHYWTTEDFEHMPCEYTSNFKTDGCRMSLCMDQEVYDKLPRMLVAEGSDKALEYLKQRVYLAEINKDEN